jgi:predicted nucleotidyltransferase
MHSHAKKRQKPCEPGARSDALETNISQTVAATKIAGFKADPGWTKEDRNRQPKTHSIVSTDSTTHEVEAMSDDLLRIQQILSRNRDGLFRRYPLKRLGIFGSVVRGDAGPDSDVDILVEFSGPIGFEVADLAGELEEILGRPVDLLTAGAIRERMRARIESSLVYV